MKEEEVEEVKVGVEEAKAEAVVTDTVADSDPVEKAPDVKEEKANEKTDEKASEAPAA